MASAAWWAAKVRQARSHALGRVTPAERAALAGWLTPAQLRLFEAMHRADQRHGLDVVADLRAAGLREPDVLLAGLLHDAGKGPSVRLAHRVAWSLGEAYGPWVWRLVAAVPTFGPALTRLRDHAESSARLAAAAGCAPRTVELIRHQAAPVDPEYGEALRLADEAN
ncbi:MAG TPA: hypothetical protein VF763_04110 [Candidatus Limnocylindrales bacterium]